MPFGQSDELIGMVELQAQQVPRSAVDALPAPMQMQRVMC